MIVRKIFYILSIIIISVFVVSSCKKNKINYDDHYIDASSKDDWHYISLRKNRIIASEKDDGNNNSVWARKKNWDIAIKRFYVRTNSGTSSSIDAKGGLYICDKLTKYDDIQKIDKNTHFAEDEIISSEKMGGGNSSGESKSKAVCIVLKRNSKGNLIMPPVYEKSPIYIFRSADGKDFYKIEFVSYKNEKNKSGHIRYKLSSINME